MSIQQEYEVHYLVCDNCGNTVGCESFGSAVEAKKMLGWKSKKVNGEWEDWCDECCKGRERVARGGLI